MANLLNDLGASFKISFDALVSETDVSLYSNVITARHGVGHRHGSNITLDEISRGIDAADKIMAALNQCFEKNDDSKPKAVSSVGSPRTVLFTGTLEKMTRQEAKTQAEQHGFRPVGSLSKKTDFVVAGPGTGMKLAQAEKLGVKILSENEWLHLLGEQDKQR